MAIDNYVDKILNSPVYVFDEIIEKLIAKNLQNAKIELSRHRLEVDETLIEAIKSILKELKEEEGIISRFLYATFGVELRKNKRREQLIYLGSELKTQHLNIKSKLYVLNRQKERLSYSIKDLGRLKEGFSEKSMFFENDKIKNKSKFYIDELEAKIAQLQEYWNTIVIRYNNSSDIEKIYNNLFKQIPRYKELNEEAHLLLLSPTKK